MDALRGKSSEIGRAYAVGTKATGKSLTQLEEYYAAKAYSRAFSTLSSTQKNAVWSEIVFAAGRPKTSANNLARVFGATGRAFIALTIVISAYNIVTAKDKTQAVANEGAGAGAGGGLLGSVAGGAATGLMCGPGALVCVTIGVFAGGVMFAIGAQVAFDSFWR